jgi:hypothetical protein
MDASVNTPSAFDLAVWYRRLPGISQSARWVENTTIDASRIGAPAASRTVPSMRAGRVVRWISTPLTSAVTSKRTFGRRQDRGQPGAIEMYASLPGFLHAKERLTLHAGEHKRAVRQYFGAGRRAGARDVGRGGNTQQHGMAVGGARHKRAVDEDLASDAKTRPGLHGHFLGAAHSSPSLELLATSPSPSVPIPVPVWPIFSSHARDMTSTR